MSNGVTSTLDTGANTVSFANAIGSTTTGALTKTGAGSLTLAGVNTYTGTTMVSAGTLLVNGALGNTAVTANAGTFGGTGTAGTSAVTINTTATFSPGNNGTGSLEVAGNLSLLAGSTTTIELGGTAFTLNGAVQYDRTKLTGSTPTLTLGGGLTLVDQIAMTANQAFGIFQLESGATRTGTFAGLTTDGSQVGTIDGFAVFITYSGNFGDSGTVSTFGGNDIVLYTIPEPSTALLEAIGLLALLRRRR